ncbi:MAG TPA: hypothetical protein VF765_33890 [Polyangiaceae bacterium]
MRLLLLTMILAFAACSSSSSSGGSASSASPHSCDPLAPSPTSLSGVLGVGQDAQGTLYVADSPPNAATARVFVSGGGKLVRQDVLGSGEMGGGKGGVADEYTLSFVPAGGDPSAARALLLAMQGGTASQMALGPGNSKSFIGGPGETPLKVVGESAVSGMPVVNLPDVADYVADVSDGTAIVVTSPLDINSSADFHLFYGRPSAMLERTITSFNQALSGYPTIAFTVGSSTYTMAISGTFDPDGGGGPGPGTLQTASSTLDFTLRMPTPTTLSGFSFTCL